MPNNDSLDEFFYPHFTQITDTYIPVSTVIILITEFAMSFHVCVLLASKESIVS